MRTKRSSSVVLCCIISLLLMTGIGTVAAQNLSTMRVTLDLKAVSVKEFFDAVKKQTSLNFIYSSELEEGMPPVTIQGNNQSVKSVLDKVIGGAGCVYEVDGNIVTISKRQTGQLRKVYGQVVDDAKLPLPGVNVYIKDSKYYTSSDDNGKYTIEIPVEDCTLTFSYIGMKQTEVHCPKGTRALKQDVVLLNDTKIDEVVITGIITKNKSSFTGSASSFSGKELKSIGTQNVIASLKALDPSFNVLDNNLYGSDPNRLPDINIRGKSSIVGLKETFGTDPNQPLFILDGFETSLQTIMDLNMNRIESVTILKDAASTAIYGSKAANGVVVIETKKPAEGKLRLTYKGDVIIDMPDLSGYNLMNASEKLQFEKLSGRFDAFDSSVDLALDTLYQRYRADVARGVDSYWLSEPVRTGITHKHSFYVDGGGKELRFGVGIDYSSIAGVMKSSSRDMFSGAIDLIYRKGTLQFSNKLSIDWVKSDNPVVSFKEFAQANPYFRKYDTNGDILPFLEQSNLPGLQGNNIANPLWDDHLDNYDEKRQTGVRNNFIIEWNPFTPLKLRARFGITKNIQRQETFYDPQHSSFRNIAQIDKGKFTGANTDYMRYEGDFSVIFGKLFNEKHQVNAVGGWSVNSDHSDMIGFDAIGFASGQFSRPSFSSRYPEGGKATSYESTSRATSFFANTGYSYDNRYLLDANYRLDGSSIFGSNRRFTNTWSVGLAWNIHNESFIKDNADWMDILKVRGSIGNPGNQNFSSYLAFSTYSFNTQYLNRFGVGTSLINIGNPDLKWQKTLDMNAGTDISLFGRRLNLTLDVYRKNTDPLFVRINVPASVGVRQINTNIGKQINTGINGTLSFSPVYIPENRINWTLSVNARHEKAKYDGIGNSLNSLNELNKESRDFSRYYDGGSPTAIWAVRSAGIDPATGRELFIKKNGETTFNYSYDDEVVVGNTLPNVEGIIGSSLYYKGFSFSFYLRYQLGAQIFNSSLYNKVENIGQDNLIYNQDKRALYDRWQKPGDIAKFKSIKDSEYTPMSSRFVMDENVFSGESFQMGYEFTGKWLQAAGISVMTLQAYTSNIFRISSVKEERGIEYPFARSVSFSLGLTF